MATLWRVRGAEGVSPAQVVDRLRSFDDFFRPSATRDESGDLLVSFFASANDGRTALEKAKSALTLAAEPNQVTIRSEWGGVVTPEPDRSRPETFPQIPTVEWLQHRSKGLLFESAAAGEWFDVKARVESISGSASLDGLVADLRLNLRAMRRFDRPKVSARAAENTIVLTFGVTASDPATAEARAADAVETALSASAPADTEAEIRIVEVTRRSTT